MKIIKWSTKKNNGFFPVEVIIDEQINWKINIRQNLQLIS